MIKLCKWCKKEFDAKGNTRLCSHNCLKLERYRNLKLNLKLRGKINYCVDCKIELSPKPTSKRCRKCSMTFQFKMGKRQWNTGIKMSDSTRAKMSIAKKGKRYNLGYKQTEEHKRKISIANSGSNCHLWKGGIWTKTRMAWCFRQRKIREKQNGGSHTDGEWEELKKKYNYTCLCCGKSEPVIKLSKDHIIPVIKGGKNDIKNLQPLCRRCNSQKHTDDTNYINKYIKISCQN